MVYENTIIYLLGYPGAGKYTIGKELSKKFPEFRLVDNHLINNPVFSLIHLDGKTKLPERVWDNVGKIWGAVLDTMIHISAPSYSFILTNALFNTTEEKEWFEEIKKMAELRKSQFIPVVLKISLEAHKERISNPDRKERMKETNPSSPYKYAKENNLFIPNHPNLYILDVSKISPEIAAQKIILHLNILRGEQ